MQDTDTREAERGAEHSFADRIIDALQFFADGPPLVRLSDLARHLNIPPSSAHRVVAPLVRRGLLERTADRRYSIGSERGLRPSGKAASIAAMSASSRRSDSAPALSSA